MKRAGFVKHCFCTLHICGYVASLERHILVVAPTGSCAVAADETSTFYPGPNSLVRNFVEGS